MYKYICDFMIRKFFIHTFHECLQTSPLRSSFWLVYKRRRIQRTLAWDVDYPNAACKQIP